MAVAEKVAAEYVYGMASRYELAHTVRMRSDKAELLSRSMLFSTLADPELEDLAALAYFKHIDARQAICHKGSRGDEMFAIVRGRMKVGVSSEAGKEAIFDILGEGDFFGEIALLDGLGRSATVTAVEPCEILAITRDSFVLFLEQQPKISIKLLAVLCQRLRATDELLENIHFLNLPARLGKALTALAERHGKQTAEGVAIDLKFSQEELGNLVRASRESVNKQLKTWEGQGMLYVRPGQIVIRKPLPVR